MEMENERDSDIGEESPISNNEDELSEGEGGDSVREGGDSVREPDESFEEIRRQVSTVGVHANVLARLEMQVRDVNPQGNFDNNRHLNYRAMPLARNFGAPAEALLAPFIYPVVPPFMNPPVPPPQPQPTTSSGSSHSDASDGSQSSQQATWSFEEQFKQLYELSDDPRRKEFLDELFSFMQRKNSPINRLPIMAKSVLDLYELYNLVVARGGLVDVINKKLWQEIIKGLHLPSSITSAAFTLRTQYMKYLYPYECNKLNLSNPTELQAAIDGNRREGRRSSSFGPYDNVPRGQIPSSQMSPISLVQQQHQLAARISSSMHNGGPHHSQPGGSGMNGGGVHDMSRQEMEARMLEYIKQITNPQVTPPQLTSSPLIPQPLTPYELTRSIAMWSAYNSTTNGNGNGNNGNSHVDQLEPQQEALNLSEPSTSSLPPSRIKREIEADVLPPPKKFIKDAAAARNHVPSKTSIKIGSTSDEEKSIVVSMELNGIQYEGVLFAPNGTS